MLFRSWNSARILLVLAATLVTAPIFANPPARFVQVEQEGHLGNIPEDAKGNFFAWYAPVEYDDALVEKVLEQATGWSRFKYGAWRRVWPSKQKFDDLGIAGKVRYLELLAEKLGACQRGVPCELLVRRDGAPTWLSKHPFFEARPGAAATAPVSYWYPEITTAKEQPAADPKEALKRHDEVIRRTGLDSPHFHVFVRVPRAQFVAQREALLARLQRVNDDLFLANTRSTLVSAFHPTLRPWTEGMTTRARETMTRLGPTAVGHVRDDDFDPKRVNVAFRYWGEEKGEVLISLELRGMRTVYAYPPRRKEIVRFDEGAHIPKKERSFAALASMLDRLWVVAGDLLGGKLADVPHVVRKPDLARMEAAIAKVAAEEKITQYVGYADFIKIVYELDTPSAGLLYPFSDPNRGVEDPSIRQFVEDFLQASVKLKEGFQGHNYHNQMFWGAYDRWVQREQRYLSALPIPGVADGDRCGVELYQEGKAVTPKK